MRIATIVLLGFLGCAVSNAEEMMTTADFERQANIDAAKEKADELRRILAGLENKIESEERRLRDEARDEARTPQPQSGKTTRERTEGKIVNGVGTGAFPTAGALIYGAVAGSAGSHCTGTLIGPQTFLTAAHCVEGDLDEDMYHVYLQHGGIFEVSDIDMHCDFEFPHADLAIVKLKQRVNGITPTRINTRVIANGSDADIVGYGRAGGFNHDYGIKRVGGVQTAACDPGRPTSLLCWNFDDPVGSAGLDSNTCNADSGGPLYVQEVADGPLTLAGVTSGGTLGDCLAGDHSYDVDVRQFETWITDEANGDLGGDAGSLAPWGSEKVRTLHAEVEFAATLRDRIYTLSVPANTKMLRVAMNGHDEGSRNFDLYVKEGSGVSITDNDCAQDGSGQYAFCEFQDPDEGTWSVLLNAANGNGVAQVSATLFEE